MIESEIPYILFEDDEEFFDDNFQIFELKYNIENNEELKDYVRIEYKLYSFNFSLFFRQYKLKNYFCLITLVDKQSSTFQIIVCKDNDKIVESRLVKSENVIDRLIKIKKELS